MPAIAPPLAVAPEDLHTLGQWSRSSSIRAALVERAKILLLAAQGTSNTEIARRVGCSRPTVILWRHRYAQAGLDGLADQLGISHNTVARVWADHDLKPWRLESFKFSTDPQLEAKVRDVVGLYLHPPERVCQKTSKGKDYSR